MPPPGPVCPWQPPQLSRALEGTPPSMRACIMPWWQSVQRKPRVETCASWSPSPGALTARFSMAASAAPASWQAPQPRPEWQSTQEERWWAERRCDTYCALIT